MIYLLPKRITGFSFHGRPDAHFVDERFIEHVNVRGILEIERAVVLSNARKPLVGSFLLGL